MVVSTVIDMRDDITFEGEQNNSRASVLCDESESAIFRKVIDMSRLLNIPQCIGRDTAQFVNERFSDIGAGVDTLRFRAFVAAALGESGARFDTKHASKLFGVEKKMIKKQSMKIKQLFMPSPKKLGEIQKKLFEASRVQHEKTFVCSPAVDSNTVPNNEISLPVLPCMTSSVAAESNDDTNVFVQEKDEGGAQDPLLQSPAPVAIDQDDQDDQGDQDNQDSIEGTVNKLLNKIRHCFPPSFDLGPFAKKVTQKAVKNSERLMGCRPSTLIFASIVQCWEAEEGLCTEIPWQRIKDSEGPAKKTIVGVLKKLE